MYCTVIYIEDGILTKHKVFKTMTPKNLEALHPSEAVSWRLFRGNLLIFFVPTARWVFRKESFHHCQPLPTAPNETQNCGFMSPALSCSSSFFRALGTREGTKKTGDVLPELNVSLTFFWSGYHKGIAMTVPGIPGVISQCQYSPPPSPLSQLDDQRQALGNLAKKNMQHIIPWEKLLYSSSSFRGDYDDKAYIYIYKPIFFGEGIKVYFNIFHIFKPISSNRLPSPTAGNSPRHFIIFTFIHQQGAGGTTCGWPKLRFEDGESNQKNLHLPSRNHCKFRWDECKRPKYRKISNKSLE